MAAWSSRPASQPRRGRRRRHQASARRRPSRPRSIDRPWPARLRRPPVPTSALPPPHSPTTNNPLAQRTNGSWYHLLVRERPAPPDVLGVWCPNARSGTSLRPVFALVARYRAPPALLASYVRAVPTAGLSASSVPCTERAPLSKLTAPKAVSHRRLATLLLSVNAVKTAIVAQERGGSDRVR